MLQMHIGICLQKIIIQDSHLGDIDRDSFRGISALETLILWDCNLTSIPTLQHIKNQVVGLKLNGLKIQELPDDFVLDFTRLETISVSRNRLEVFPKLTGIHNSVRSISLKNNKISDIRNLYIDVFPELVILELNSNLISKFCFHNAAQWPSLETVRLVDNRITAIQVPRGYDYLFVDVGNNPLVCGDMPWLSYCRYSVITGLIGCSPDLNVLMSDDCISEANGTGNMPDTGRVRHNMYALALLQRCQMSIIAS